jgi:hypothetical protein
MFKTKTEPCQFVITYANGDTWEPPMGSWKDVAAFITEWERESYLNRWDRKIVNVERKLVCECCQRPHG